MAITSTDPATGEQLREFAPLTPTEIEDKLSCAGRAARSWGSTPLDDRTRVLRRAADLLDERRDEYGKLMTREMGKTFAAAKDEAAKCATSLRYYADHAAEFLADASRSPSTANASYVAFEPLGVVLAVMPWNFPFWQVIRFAAPALAAGNVGLLKHASNVPQCALALEQLFADAGAPGGVFQTLLIEAEPGRVAHRRRPHRRGDAHRERSRGNQRRVGGRTVTSRRRCSSWAAATRSSSWKAPTSTRPRGPP